MWRVGAEQRSSALGLGVSRLRSETVGHASVSPLGVEPRAIELVLSTVPRLTGGLQRCPRHHWNRRVRRAGGVVEPRHGFFGVDTRQLGGALRPCGETADCASYHRAHGSGGGILAGPVRLMNTASETRAVWLRLLLWGTWVAWVWDPP